jgi:hypothetical protein
MEKEAAKRPLPPATHLPRSTSATGARQGREVCTSHARSLHVHWFDDDDGGVGHIHG